MTSIRARAAGLFVLGFAAGALSILYVLWRTGGLAPHHWLARRTPELTSRPTRVPPLPTIPSPTRVPTTVSSGPPAPAPTSPAFSDFSLGSESFRMPVEGARATELKDNFAETRGGTRRHEAIDILAPRGTPVVAAVDGRVAKLFTSHDGGLTVYQFDRDATNAYYYAHLDRYGENLREGAELKKGDRIGYVGSSGNAPASTPHLHFAIFRLGPEKRWWEGTPVDPYPLLLRSR